MYIFCPHSGSELFIYPSYTRSTASLRLDLVFVFVLYIFLIFNALIFPAMLLSLGFLTRRRIGLKYKETVIFSEGILYINETYDIIAIQP